MDQGKQFKAIRIQFKALQKSITVEEYMYKVDKKKLTSSKTQNDSSIWASITVVALGMSPDPYTYMIYPQCGYLYSASLI